MKTKKLDSAILVATAQELRPLYVRIPAVGESDPVFGLRRGWYYSAEAMGLLKLRRVNMPGRTRGVVLVRVADVEALIEKGVAK